MLCPNCNLAVSNSVEFCPSCGCRLPRGSSSTHASAQVEAASGPRVLVADEKKRGPVAAIILILLMLVCLSAFFAYRMWFGSADDAPSQTPAASSAAEAEPVFVPESVPMQEAAPAVTIPELPEAPVQEAEAPQDPGTQEAEIDTALSAAQAQADSGDYAGAIDTIRTAIDTYGEDPLLTEALEDYQARYRQSVITEAAQLVLGEGYETAIQIIDTGLSILGEDGTLQDLLDLYKSRAALD